LSLAASLLPVLLFVLAAGAGKREQAI